jgi:hypothetical protein
MRQFFRRKSTSQLRKEFLMAAQDDVNSAVAAINAAASTLETAASQLSGLGIPTPIDTSALAPATSALAKAVGDVQTAVSAEVAKINPPPSA